MFYWFSESKEDERRYLESDIKSFEYNLSHPRNTKDSRRMFDDLKNDFYIKVYKIVLNLNYNNKDVAIDRRCINRKWSEIRMKSCLLASKGRTFNVSDLNDEEIEDTRKTIKQFSNEYIKTLEP